MIELILQIIVSIMIVGPFIILVFYVFREIFYSTFLFRYFLKLIKGNDYQFIEDIRCGDSVPLTSAKIYLENDKHKFMKLRKISKQTELDIMKRIKELDENHKTILDELKSIDENVQELESLKC